MADYRQSCSTPGCSYTGFTGHSPGCPVPYEMRVEAKRQKERQDSVDRAWRDFFESMTVEELFKYRKRCEDEIAKVARFRVRIDRVNEYMRRNDRNLLRRYMDWKKSG